MVPRLTPGGFPEILRAAQKDEAAMQHFTQEVSTNFALKVFGPRAWLRWKPWIEASAQFAYFALTTLSDLQTLGEEYTGILQITPKNGKIKLPSKLRRFVMVFFQTFGHLIIKQLAESMLKTLDKTDRRKLTIEIFVELCDFVSKFNVMWFFIRGGFYHLSKRILNIQYVKLRPWNGADPDDSQASWIRVFSVVNCAILVYELILKVKSKWEERNVGEEQAFRAPQRNIEVSHRKKCPLCLDVRSNATSTICGHIFCWSCIHECVLSTSECPICRESLSPSRLIPLMNYSWIFIHSYQQPLFSGSQEKTPSRTSFIFSPSKT